MSPQTIIFIGRSGCGKGTQAELLRDYLEKNDTNKRHIFYVETGAGVREMIKGESLTNKLSRSISQSGNRQPSFIAISIWSKMFIEKMTGEEHLLVDGAARSTLEAMVLCDALKFYQRRAKIIYLDVDHDESFGRLVARGRADDLDPVEVKKRLAWFESDVVPAIEYLKKQTDHDFYDINGQQPIKNVHEDIVALLK